MDALKAAALRGADRAGVAVLAIVTLVLGGIGAPLLRTTVNAGADDASWTAYPPMTLPRAWPEVVVLPDGNIFVTGGYSTFGPTATTEIFDVDDGLWKAGPTMAVKRVGHTATLLGDGKVLVTGGETGSGTTDRVELIDVAGGISYMLPDMTFSRSGHAAVALQDGRVLVTGGTDYIHGSWSQAEMYDPESHLWTPAGTMNHPRVFLTIQLLDSGDAIAIGGDTEGTSEQYDPSSGGWHGVRDMNAERINSASIVTKSGHVLVAGGGDSGGARASTEMYDPNSMAWFPAGSMLTPRAHFTLSLLSDGRIMAAGSWTEDEGTTSTAELFCQCTMGWTATASMAKSRGAHGAAELPDGNLLMIGGRRGDSILSSTEMYTPPTTEPPPPYCQPKDILPFVAAVESQMPGYSFHGLVSKILVAQTYYDDGLIEDCLHLLDAFYNEVTAFLHNKHVDEEGISSLYAAYASVVVCLGGTPLPEIP